MRARITARALFAVVFGTLVCGAASACGASNAPLVREQDATGATPTPTPTGAEDGGGTDAAQTPPAGRTLDLPTTAERVAATLCGFHERCFETYVKDVFGSVTKCRERYATAFRSTHVAEAVFSESVVDAMGTCERALGCDALYGGKWQTACRSPRPANARKDGEACVGDASCESEACLPGSGATACGRCVARVSAAIGEACGDGARRCTAGLTCLSSKRCVAVKSINDDCDTTNNLCGNGLTCKANKCARLPAAGETCDERAGCDPYRLAGCNAQGTCASVTYLASAATCEVGALETCGSGEVCTTSSDSGAQGTCMARKPVGQPCRRAGECELFATCTQNLCADPKAPSCAP